MTSCVVDRRDEGFTLVELLVVIAILAVIGGALTTALISAYRVEETQSELQTVIDDGRLSLTRIRQELRQARQIFADSDSDELRFWVDANQNGFAEIEEHICWVLEALPGGAAGQYQIVRWTEAIDDSSCDPGGARPSGTTERVLARTLTNTDPFYNYEPVPSNNVNDPETREVTIRLELEVVTGRGPTTTELETTVRLRNVA